MGIIQRQSIKFSIINFIGTFIGFLSVVFIYSLDNELYGYFQSLHSYATLLVPILGLGVQGAIVKYFPLFVQKNREKHFLMFTLAIATASAVFASLVVCGLYYLFYPFLNTIFANFKLIEDNKYSILLLSYIFLYSSIFLFHATVRFRIVIPDLINSIGLKLFLPCLILLIYFGYIQRSFFVISVVIYFLLVGISLFAYLLKLDRHSWQPEFRSLDRSEYNGLLAFMVFSVLNGLGATFALKIDIAMIGAMISKEAVTIYSIIMTISNVMDIPSKAINQIAGPVISKSWADGDHNNIQDVYQKSSVFGLIGGVFLFLLLFSIWSDVLELMPGKFTDYHTVIWIFTLLGIAKITDLITGVNSVIISYSADYRFHMYFLVLLGVINVLLNYFLIQHFGAIGAAIATCISYVVFNLLKHLFVQKRFGFVLDFGSHFKILLAGSIVFTILYVIPFQLHPVLNVILKTIIISAAFGGLMWIFNPGVEIRNTFREAIRNFRSYLPG